MRTLLTALPLGIALAAAAPAEAGLFPRLSKGAGHEGCSAMMPCAPVVTELAPQFVTVTVTTLKPVELEMEVPLKVTKLVPRTVPKETVTIEQKLVTNTYPSVGKEYRLIPCEVDVPVTTKKLVPYTDVCPKTGCAVTKWRVEEETQVQTVVRSKLVESEKVVMLQSAALSREVKRTKRDVVEYDCVPEIKVEKVKYVQHRLVCEEVTIPIVVAGGCCGPGPALALPTTDPKQPETPKKGPVGDVEGTSPSKGR